MPFLPKSIARTLSLIGGFTLLIGLLSLGPIVRSSQAQSEARLGMFYTEELAAAMADAPGEVTLEQFEVGVGVEVRGKIDSVRLYTAVIADGEVQDEHASSPFFPGSKWTLAEAEAATDGEYFPDEYFFPTSTWVPGDSWFPGSRWVPGDSWDELPASVLEQGEFLPEGTALRTDLLEASQQGPILYLMAVPGSDWADEIPLWMAPMVVTSPGLEFPGSSWVRAEPGSPF